MALTLHHRDGEDSSGDESEGEEEAAVADRIQQAQRSTDDTAAHGKFDLDIAAQHRYLGDVDDLGGGYAPLEEGALYQLPLFMLEGSVLLPGCQLPLLLYSGHDTLKVERALRTQGPTAKLIAVASVCGGALCLVGCTAEVRQLKRQAGSGAVALLARGRQRVQIRTAGAFDTARATVCVMPEGVAGQVPRPVREGAAFWPAWAGRPFDALGLARQAQQAAAGLQLESAGALAQADPRQLQLLGPLRYSYWLAANLPLSSSQRQQLLEARDAAARLRLLLRWLRLLGSLACSECGTEVASSSSLLQMSSEGTGGTFVNPHGYVHDMATFRSVRSVVCVGRPETQHSWFPGYAWTCCLCAGCGEHLGWRFTAAREGLAPALFWGLRRPAIACARLDHDRTREADMRRAAAAAAAGVAASDASGGESEEGEGEGEAPVGGAAGGRRSPLTLWSPLLLTTSEEGSDDDSGSEGSGSDGSGSGPSGDGSEGPAAVGWASAGSGEGSDVGGGGEGPGDGAGGWAGVAEDEVFHDAEAHHHDDGDDNGSGDEADRMMMQ